MTAKSIDRTFTFSAARIILALLLTVLLVFPDLALAQEPVAACNNTPNTWVQSSTSLQSPMETFAAAVATVNSTTYLYVLGGMNCNTSTGYNCSSSGTAFQTKVGRATMDPTTGALGAFVTPWQDLWTPPGGSGPVGLGRDLCGAIYTSPTTLKNYIYTVGGYALFAGSTTPVLTNQVWYAQLYPTTGQNNGELLTWHQAMKADGVTPITLPSALDLEGVAVLNGYLYVIGGSTNVDPTVAAAITDQVWSAQLNQNSGNLMSTGFTSQPAILPPPVGVTYTGGIYKTCPVAYPTSSSTGMIYVAGGETNNPTLPNNPLTGTVEYAVQVANGVLTDGMGNSQWGTASSLPVTLASQAVVYNTGIILMGGQYQLPGHGSTDTDNVYLGTINSNSMIGWGTLSPLSTVITGNIERNAGAANGNFIYSLGGEVSHNGSSDSPYIYCLEL
jgi:hypothetical protein